MSLLGSHGTGGCRRALSLCPAALGSGLPTRTNGARKLNSCLLAEATARCQRGEKLSSQHVVPGRGHWSSLGRGDSRKGCPAPSVGPGVGSSPAARAGLQCLPQTRHRGGAQCPREWGAVGIGLGSGRVVRGY